MENKNSANEDDVGNDVSSGAEDFEKVSDDNIIDRKESQRLKEEVKKQKELLLRTAAEYDNFRKRSEKEKRAVYNDAVAKTIELFLPAVDSIDMAKQNIKDMPKEYLRGLELIENQINASFEKIGIEECGKVGDKFDPNFHNAVVHMEDENLGENVIVEVLQKGYVISGKVIRYAMVKVAN